MTIEESSKLTDADSGNVEIPSQRITLIDLWLSIP